MKRIYSIAAFLFIPFLLSSQCDCTDCPITVDDSSDSSTIDINGAANGTLDVNGQQVCQVCIELLTDAMNEFNATIIAPNGSSIDLIIDTGLSLNENSTFEICFVSCDQSANPDSGFPSTFDSSADYPPNGFYNGTYYPADGNCLEDLTGPVDGDWDLEISDEVPIAPNTLLGWNISFADDTGLNCSNPGACGSPVSCIAEGGELDADPIDACIGDTELNFTELPSFPNNNEAPSSDYDYTYIITDVNTGIIADITMTTDLTAYSAGSYQVCGLSYDIDDASSIPSADGSLTIDDIQDDIDDENYCADISDICIDIVIGPLLPDPIISGPSSICIGELVEYEIINYDPSLTYLVQFISGGFSMLSVDDEIITMEIIAGPVEFCVIIDEACAPPDVCLLVDVTEPEELEIIGEFSPCPNDIETYNLSPDPESTQMYVVVVTGGNILNQTDNTVDIQWDNANTTGSICIELTDSNGGCVGESICEDIDVELDYELPPTLNSPIEFCLGDVVTSFITDDTSISNYSWTGTNLTIVSGQGTEEVSYSADGPGLSTICLEITTECGDQGPICEDIEVYEYPDPMIVSIPPTCAFTFLLDANVSGNSDIEWELISGPGDIDFSPDDNVPSTATVTQEGIYTVRLIEDTNGCEAFDEIMVEILSSLSITDPDYDCNLDNEYTVTFDIISGTAPYTINGTQITGSIYTSDPIDSEDSFDFEVIDVLGCSQNILGAYTCPCTTDAGTMPDDILSACAAEGNSITVLWNQDGFLDNDDIGRYYVHDGDDNNFGNVITSNDIGTFEYDPALMEPNTSYFISYVVGNDINGEPDFDDDCVSISNGQEIIFLLFEELIFDYPTFSCENQIDIEGFLTGSATYIEWVQIAGPGTITFDSEQSLPTTVSSSAPGEYIIAYSYGNNSCDETYELDIVFEELPTIQNLSEDCNTNNDAYAVSFEIIGEEPFQVTLPGSFDGDVFTSDPITSGDQYTIVVTDANGCESPEITGIKLCDCDSFSGTMTPDLVEVCGVEDSIFADIVTGPFLDMNDIGIYFLHTSNSSTLGDIIDSNDNGGFGYMPQIVLDSIYYVSYVVGNALNGSIDINDQCVDVSMGQPVRWNSIPEVAIIDDTNTCDFSINLNASPANGTWRIIDKPAGSNAIITDPNDANTELRLDVIGDYYLEWTTNGLCPNMDTTIITQSPVPSLTNLTTSCAADLMSYTVSFDIDDIGGPFTVNGVPSSPNFSADMIDPDIETSFEIENNSGCVTSLSVGPIMCECMSDPGTVNIDRIELCTSELLTVDISNQDFILEEGDTIAYILHDGDVNNIGNVIALSYGEPIAYDNSIQTNEVYYLNVIIGEFSNGIINLNDPCFDASMPVLVEWIEETTISIVSNNSEICLGDTSFFEVDISGLYPVTLVFESDMGQLSSQTLENSDDQLEFIAQSETEVWTLLEIDAACPGDVDTELSITAQAPWEIRLTPDIEVCNNPLFNTTVILDDLLQEMPPDGEWTIPQIPVTNGILDFSNIPEGEYIIEYSTIGYEPSCPGSIQAMTITVVPCDCPVFSTPPLIECNNVSSIDLSQYDTQGYNGSWSISNINNLANPPDLNLNTLVIDNRTPGDYILTYLIFDNDYPDACDSEITFDITIDGYLSSGTQMDIAEFCDEDISITLFDLVDNEDLGGTWLLDGTVINSDIELSDLPLGDSQFTYEIINNNSCPSESTEVILTKNEKPDFTFASTDVICFGDANGEIEIIIENPSGQIFTYYVNDIAQADNSIISGLTSGNYTIYIEAENGCQSNVENIIIDEPEPITVNLGEDQELEINDEVTIQAIVSILESDIDAIEWTDLSGILDMDTLSLTTIISEDNTISMQVIDINGCIAFDDVRITVLSPPPINAQIYVPNVFRLGDVENNTFRIFDNGSIERINAFNIYDRWGNLVYEKENILAESEEAAWDGFYKNSAAEIGVYVVFYNLLLTDGSTRIITQDITLLR